MVNYSGRRLDRTFAALSDPTRRSMLSRLRRGEATVGELAEPFRISLPAISKHLGILERAGLVERKREGRTQRCRLRGAPLGEAFSWLDHYRDFWEGTLDRLGGFLDAQAGAQKK
jgi:DNA-binding transcriptional ArsR family regulator